MGGGKSDRLRVGQLPDGSSKIVCVQGPVITDFRTRKETGRLNVKVRGDGLDETLEIEDINQTRRPDLPDGWAPSVGEMVPLPGATL